MKILFLSDIHGSLPALERVLSFYDAEGYELLVLLGDILNYGPRNGLCEGLDPTAIADRLNERAEHIMAVRGNCDSEVDGMLLHFPIQADYALILLPDGRRVFATHGHVYNEQNLPVSPSCDVFISGHTHLPHITPATSQTPMLINTGSPTFPKGGNPPTFATLDEDGVFRLRLLDGSAME